MENIDQIIQRMRDSYNLNTDKELASRLGLGASAVATWKQKNTVPYKQLCQAVLDCDLNLRWLMFGEGEKNETPNDYINVPEYKIEASAGHGALVEDETPSQYIAIKKANLAAAGVNTSNLMIIYARGDSMEPTFYSGDPLFIDRTFHTVAPEGGIYVFNYNGELFVKRLQLAFTGDLLVISDNDKYPNMTIPKAELGGLKVVGRVAVYGRICA
ncbi:LexA family transcriptional regulator [Marinomonas fungiae]|uniref:LexA family transcriptional regulator n=1 Tax=Marinomonas fungiae TaxID=1137284 RepID=UPI003A92EB36